MVVWSGSEVDRLSRKLSTHAEMDSKPTVLTEAKKHLFSAGMGGEKDFSGNRLFELSRRDTAKDPFSCVKMDRSDFSFDSGIPLFTEEFNFGQFGHP